MKKNIKKIIVYFCLITLAVIFIFIDPLENIIAPLLAKLNIEINQSIKPCSQTISYSLGRFDEEFKISQTDFIKALSEAEGVWEETMNQDLFDYDQENGELKINLIYDSRQEITNILSTLSQSVKNDKASYDLLKNKYLEIEKEYNDLKNTYETELIQFEKQISNYEQEVNDWNKKASIPGAEKNRLIAEREFLEIKVIELQKMQRELNNLATEYNYIINELNRLSGILNITAEKYNKLGLLRGEIFQKALYQSSVGEQQIDVYEFSNRTSLVRVLAHELGHALGLEHMSNPDSIMYEINNNQNTGPTNEEIEALKNLCRLD